MISPLEPAKGLSPLLLYVIDSVLFQRQVATGRPLRLHSPAAKGVPPSNRLMNKGWSNAELGLSCVRLAAAG